MLSRVFLKDKALNGRDRGVFSTILSLPSDWNLSVSGLATILPDGETAIRASLNNLTKMQMEHFQNAYMSLTKIRMLTLRMKQRMSRIQIYSMRMNRMELNTDNIIIKNIILKNVIIINLSILMRTRSMKSEKKSKNKSTMIMPA